MTKEKNSLLTYTIASALGVALLCGGAQVAEAQGYGDGTIPYESVIIHPNSYDYGRIETHQLVGRIDGEVDPTMLTISEPVNYSDLDLSRPSDRRELRLRVHDTAVNLCGQLAAHDINAAGDEDSNRECIRQAIRTAMTDLPNLGPEG